MRMLAPSNQQLLVKLVFALFTVVSLTLVSFTPLIAQGVRANAAALPLPSGNEMFFVGAQSSITPAPLNKVTGVNAGSISFTSTCATTCSTGWNDWSSGGFYNRDDNMIYTADGQGAQRFTLVKYAAIGASAGTPVSVGSSGADYIFGLAKGPEGVFGLGNSLFSVNIATGGLTMIGALSGDYPGNQTLNGFAYNQLDHNYYFMSRDSANLYQLNVATGATTLVSSGSVPGLAGSYSLQIDSNGTFWVINAIWGTPNLYTFTVSGSGSSAVISTPSLQGAFASGTTTAMVINTPPPTYTVTYTNGGGTGLDLVENIAQGSSLTLPSPTACPLSATDPCFTAPTGQRPNNWQVTSGTLSSGNSYPMTGQSVTPTSNVTLAARWTGGPVQYSTTSFTSGGTAMTSIPFPNTAVGASNQITVYAYNSGTAAISISNETVGGSGVTRQGGVPGSSCNASGGTIAAGTQCTLILQWNPSSAGALSAGSYSMQVSGPYNDAVTLTGTAAANKTVTFNFNGGSGTMSNQVAAFPTNLVANAFTRTGYSFSYWTLFSDGSGSQYVNQASYSFANNATMFANWNADSHVVTFNTDGGSSVANGSFNTDGSMNLPAAPSKSGYTFNGWFAAPTGGTALSSPFSPPGTSDITLYAQWSVDTSGGSGSNGDLPYTGNQTGQILGISDALLSIGLAITAFAMYRRRKA